MYQASKPSPASNDPMRSSTLTATAARTLLERVTPPAVP